MLCRSIRRAGAASAGRVRALTTGRAAFDVDTEVRPAHEKHRYVANVTDRWSVGNAPNGGYMAAIAITAARNELKFRDPLSVSVHFVSKADENAEADLRVKVLNKGRTTETCEVALYQGHSLRSQYVMTFGELANFKGLSWSELRAPELPALGESIEAMGSIARGDGSAFRIAKMLELHVSPDSPFATGALRAASSGKAVVEGWVGFRDGRRPCLRSMSLFNDGYPPSVLNLAPASQWVPTIEYTTHCWNRPPKGKDAPQYLRARFVTRYVCNGLLYADSELWSNDGQTLYSTSRQLARLLSPRKV